MSLDKLIDVNSLLAVLAPSRGPLINSQEADRPLGEKRQVASRSNPLSSAEKKAAAEYNACPLSISRTKEYSEGDFRSPKRRKLVDNQGARPPDNFPLANGDPKGLPFLQQPKWRKTRKRVERDTDMAVISAVEALKCHRSGSPFSLEHPGRSIARALPEWQELEREPGVGVTLHHH